MKAWRLHRPGSLDGLVLDDVPTPSIGSHDALVRVTAIGLNSSELQVVTGYWEGRGAHRERSLPFILGIEAAGEVVEIGADVQSVAPGDRVAIHYMWSCGQCHDCRTGHENTCREALQFGRNVPGAWAEMARVPAEYLLPLPQELSDQSAVALFVSGSTAWHMLIVHARLHADETVLVTGGSSGVGTAAVQVAQLAGAHVIATASNAAKCERLRALGVEHAIDHTPPSQLAEQVLELTSGRGVDVTCDVVGGEVLAAAIGALRRRGRCIVAGYMGGDHSTLSVVGLSRAEASIHGSSAWTRATARRVLDLAARGELQPVIDSITPFERLPSALARLRDRMVFGKALVLAREAPDP